MVTDGRRGPVTPKVMSVDFQTLQLDLLSKFHVGHSLWDTFRKVLLPIGDYENIYFRYSKDERKGGGDNYLRTYNIAEKWWSGLFAFPDTSFDCIDRCIASFEPSLSPFMTV
jgi:hypothetical protein